MYWNITYHIYCNIIRNFNSDEDTQTDGQTPHIVASRAAYFTAKKRNVQGTDITSEENIQGTDIKIERNVQGQTLQAKP